MNITKLIKDAHENSIEKGFYPEGVEKNIGEMLMLIISELSEALEADRKGRFSDVFDYSLDNTSKCPSNSFNKDLFERKVKDTFEDEIADVFIRLFDLCGYKGWELDESIANFKYMIFDNIGESLLEFCHVTANIKKNAYDINILYNSLLQFCQFHNIPIEKHILAKMAYNKTRPYKHNKEY